MSLHTTARNTLTKIFERATKRKVACQLTYTERNRERLHWSVENVERQWKVRHTPGTRQEQTKICERDELCAQ